MPNQVFMGSCACPPRLVKDRQIHRCVFGGRSGGGRGHLHAGGHSQAGRTAAAGCSCQARGQGRSTAWEASRRLAVRYFDARDHDHELCRAWGGPKEGLLRASCHGWACACRDVQVARLLKPIRNGCVGRRRAELYTDAGIANRSSQVCGWRGIVLCRGMVLSLCWPPAGQEVAAL